MNGLGSHLLADFENIEVEFNQAVEIINYCIDKTDVHVLNIIKNRWKNGFSVLWLLSESHISFHYWENSKYASIDFYNCTSGKSYNNCLIFMKYLFLYLNEDNCTYSTIIQRGNTKTATLQN